MPEEQNTQTVAKETDVQAPPATEETSARPDDDLENLLAQYDSGQPKTETAPAVDAGSSTVKPEQTPKTDSQESVILQKLNAMEAERTAERETERTAEAEKQFKIDMADTVEKVRGDLDADFWGPALVEGWIDSMAKQDSRLATAWAERHQNPQHFDRVVATLGRKFHEKFSKLPDKQATEDKEAVTAAVQGASTTAPEKKPTSYNGMSDAEFRKSVRDEYGFEPMQ